MDLRQRNDSLSSGTLFVCLCALALASGLIWHPVTGHSNGFNIVWHESFMHELRGGHFYPRWLSATNQGLGAPSFYFYAPLPFYVSALLEFILPLSLHNGFYIYVSSSLAILLSGLAMHQAVKQMYHTNIAMLAAALYMAMPYHLALDLWWRSAVGEFWAFVWLPLIMLGVHRQIRAQKWGFEIVTGAFAGLILSHLPSFIIAMCGAGGAALLLVALNKASSRCLRIVWQCGLAVGLALLLTAFYWYPAVTTLDLTSINHVMLSGWFSWSGNFILPSRPGSLNSVVECVALISFELFALLILLATKWKKFNSPVFIVFVLCFLVALFMATPASRIIWSVVTPLQRVQFPWRFLLLMDCSLVFVFAHVCSDKLRDNNRHVHAAVLVTSLLIGCVYPIITTQSYPKWMTDEAVAMRIANADAAEYRTRWTDAGYYFKLAHATLKAPTSAYLIDNRNALARPIDPEHLQGEAALGSMMVLKRFFYPNLRATDRLTHHSLVVTPQPKTGLAMVAVPSGRFDIRLDMPMLDEEKTGTLFSVLGVGLVVARRQRLKLESRHG